MQDLNVVKTGQEMTLGKLFGEWHVGEISSL